MIYVERGNDGRIIALHNTSSSAAQEQKTMLDEEVLAFLGNPDSRGQLMAMSDFSTVRIIEDLIDLLVHKNIINFTELPEHAQQRIRGRKNLREKIVSQDLLVHDII
jgi:hypothetical protein